MVKAREEKKPEPRWKKLLKWATLVAIFSAFIGWIQLKPSIALEETMSLDPSDPYQTLYLVSNEGTIPATDIEVACIPNFAYSPPGVTVPTPNNSIVFESNTVFPPQNFKYLSHNQKFTLPCFYATGNHAGTVFGPIPPGMEIKNARLLVAVSYAIYHANLKFLRFTETFQMRAVIAKDGSQHWVRN